MKKLLTLSGKSKENLIALYMLAPLLIIFILFSVFPLFNAVYLSFTKYDGFTTPSFIGIRNYVRMLSDETWWKSVLNTFQFIVIAYVIQVPLSLFLAVVLSGSKKFTGLFRTVIFLPNITSTAIMGIIFYFMFASYNGIVNSILINIGLINSPISWLGKPTTAKFIIMLLNSWSQIGFFMVLFMAAIQKIPKELYESASIDGANRWQQFKRVTLPMIGNMFPVITMMNILNVFQLFDSVRVLTGGGPGKTTSVMALHIYEYFFTSSGAQQGYASALSVMATIISAGVGALYFILTSKKFNHN